MKILSALVIIVLIEVLAMVASVTSAQLSQVHPHGAPLNIMTFTTNQSVTVDYDTIDKMFLHPEVKDRKIVVFSIIGAYRKGKSFLMDYCLRYMYAHYKSVNFPNNTLENKSNWIGSPDAPLTGFSWKSGPNRDTSGILIWSDIFLHEENNRTLAIVLMDTQGLFDTTTSPADNSRIFALGTLTSSFQIFNLNDVILEHQLEYLHMATDYANFVTNRPESSAGKPFQSLMFLMRDWSSSQIFHYGVDGGSRYLDTVLQIKDYQSSELKEVRNYIKSSFEQVLCFLMPHPGLGVVNDNNYDGRFSRLGDAFKDNLKQLIEWMLASKNLKIKTILGSEVTGHDFNGYFKSYFETFQSPETPKIPSIYEATVERQFENLLGKAENAYKDALKKYQPNFNSSNFNEDLEQLQKNCSYTVMLGYDATKKMGTLEHEKRYRAILEKDMKVFYDQWKEDMLKTHKRIHEIEVRNEQEKQDILIASKAKIAEVKAKLEAENQDILAKQKEMEVKIQSDLNLKDEEKEAAIKKIKDDMEQQNIQFQKLLNQTIAEQRAKNAEILKDTVARQRKAEDELKEANAKRDKANLDFQMQLQKERNENLERMKQEAKVRDAERQMEKEKREKADAERREELKSLLGKIDAESQARMKALEAEEKKREQERRDRAEERNVLYQRLQQERDARERERQLQRIEFEAKMQSMKRNAGTSTAPNLFCITFTVVIFSVLMFHNQFPK